jgi:hypothetical protein
MENDDLRNQLMVEAMGIVERFQSGDLGPMEEHEQWEKLVASQPPEQRELLQELTRFADLWRYFRERKEKLGPEILGLLKAAPKFPMPERIAKFREINQKLMERIGDACEGAQLRQ